jgi:YVTN family beta-propeller protein
VIDTSNDTVLTTVPVGVQPYGISVHPSGNLVYVANATDNNVSVIDTASNTVLTNVGVGSIPAAFGNFLGALCPLPSVTVEIQDTITDISTNISNSNLQPGTGNSLTAKLQAVLVALATGDKCLLLAASFRISSAQ